MVPPVESMQQVLALIKANLINLDFVNDPKIELTDEGWQFNQNNTPITATTMINGILDSAKLEEVDSPIIKNLRTNQLVEPVHDEMGIHTQKDGRVLLNGNTPPIPLCILGRLAKGSVIGVDAILECFEARISDWAIAAVDRLVKKGAQSA